MSIRAKYQIELTVKIPEMTSNASLSSQPPTTNKGGLSSLSSILGLVLQPYYTHDPSEVTNLLSNFGLGFGPECNTPHPILSLDLGK